MKVLRPPVSTCKNELSQKLFPTSQTLKRCWIDVCVCMSWQCHRKLTFQMTHSNNHRYLQPIVNSLHSFRSHNRNISPLKYDSCFFQPSLHLCKEVTLKMVYLSFYSLHSLSEGMITDTKHVVENSHN